jgi:hypothetical protein
MFEGGNAERDKYIYLRPNILLLVLLQICFGSTLTRKKLLFKIAIREILNYRGDRKGNHPCKEHWLEQSFKLQT